MSGLPGQLMEWARARAIMWKQWEHLRPSPPFLSVSLSTLLPIPPSKRNQTHKDTSMAAMKTEQRECGSDIWEEGERNQRGMGACGQGTHIQAEHAPLQITKNKEALSTSFTHTHKAIVGNKACMLRVQPLTSPLAYSPADSRDGSFHLPQHFSSSVFSLL